MDKIDCILDYYNSNKALFLYLYDIVYGQKENSSYILDKRYILGAKVGTIIDLFFDIKEYVVKTGEGTTYESRLFANELDRCVLHIATKVGDKYKLDNHLFDDASSLVAKLRNKLAHGDYIIDFDSNRIVFDIDKETVRINVDSFSIFTVSLFTAILAKQKQPKYTRTNFILKVKERGRTAQIKTRSEIKGIIRQYKKLIYEIVSTTGDVPSECIDTFNNCLKIYNTGKDMNILNECDKYLNKNGCRLLVKNEKIKKEYVDVICNFVMNCVDMGQIDYLHQIKRIGQIIERQLGGDSLKLSSKYTNYKNLVLLDRIKKLNKTDYQEICENLPYSYGEYQVDYDSIGMGVINMFNALFVYPFDDIYVNNFEYTDQENDGLDYSKLDLSTLHITTIDPTSKAITIEEEINASLLKDVLRVKKIVDKNEENKRRVTKEEIIEKLDSIIKEETIDLNEKKKKYDESLIKLEGMKKYYNTNQQYYYNKATIEGIRNSIAHGNYSFECLDDYNNAKITFNDIYNDNVTFKAEIKILDFLNLLETNLILIESFVESKKTKQKVLIKNK